MQLLPFQLSPLGQTQESRALSQSCPFTQRPTQAWPFQMVPGSQVMQVLPLK
jgi:hypothetical protein